MGRRATVASVAVAVAIAGGVLAGCGDSGQGLAEQACAHVHRSLDLYTEAERTTDPSTADARVKQAYDQLRLALPLAADATSQNGQWNALMTAISESARVSEGNLVTALRDECQVAADSGSQNPIAPGPASQAPGGPTPTRAQQGY